MVSQIHPLKLRATSRCYTAEDVFVSEKHWQIEVEGAYVASGWLDIYVNGEIYHLEQGEMIFIKGGTTHYYVEKQEQSVIRILKFHKEAVIYQCFDETNKAAIKALYDQIFMVHKNENISRIIDEMLQNDFQDFNECYMTAKLLELTVYLLATPALVFNKAPSTAIDNTRYLDSILKYIDENAKNKITLPMLADHLGLTESYCSKYIKQQTGMTFIEYLNGVRISRAEGLLIHTDLNITEIGYETGFSSVQTFNRVFKNMKNMSPSEYRRLGQNKI